MMTADALRIVLELATANQIEEDDASGDDALEAARAVQEEALEEIQTFLDHMTETSGYRMVGDFIRTGDTTSDPIHSVVVRIENHTIVYSMNRIGGQPFLHVWRLEPDATVKPISGTMYLRLKENFLDYEREVKERRAR